MKRRGFGKNGGDLRVHESGHTKQTKKKRRRTLKEKKARKNHTRRSKKRGEGKRRVTAERGCVDGMSGQLEGS